MPRFVILFHQLPAGSSRAAHWDLMLERDGSLMTWAISEALEPDRSIDAEQLPNHRVAYLDYEGPVSENRGSVSRWDCGTYTLIAQTDDLLQVDLAGHRCRGELLLEKAPSAPTQSWRARLSSLRPEA